MKPIRLNFSGLSTAAVGPTGFSDCSIITSGVEAIGHGLFVSDKSLATLADCLDGRTVPAYVSHAGADSDRVTKEAGFFQNFYREGEKLKAKTFCFLKSFIRNQTPTFESLIELADTAPQALGLSVVFSGSSVWEMPDGSEVDADQPMPAGALRAIPSVRFDEVASIDFVGTPAANPDGLFGSATGTISYSRHLGALAKVTAGLGELAALRSTVETLTRDRESLKAELAEAQTWDIRKTGCNVPSFSPGSSTDEFFPALPADATDAQRWARRQEIEDKAGKAAASRWAKKNIRTAAKQ